MTRINTNVPSLVAQNRLQSSNNDLQEALTRLSTGLRINSGSDDPAGLIASEALRSEITSLNKAVTNTERANQIIATADSALGQVSTLLNDIRGLVVEAANSGALSPDEIAANQLQVDSSLEAINRISQTTTFQGRKLLDGSLDFLTSGTTNFNKIQSLNIDQANLGSANSVSVDISVSSAATRAQVDIASVPQSGAGTGTITLENRTADAEATSANIVTASAADYTIAAKDGGTLDGEAGNAITFDVVAGTTSALTQSVSATFATTAVAGDYNITAKEGGAYDGFAGNSINLTVAAGSTATAQAVSGDVAVNGVADAFTISAKAGGIADGTLGNAIDVDIVSGTPTGGAASAALVGTTLTITVDDTASQTLDDIKAALEADANFQNDFEFNIGSDGNVLFRADTSDDTTGITLSGGTNVAAKADLTGNNLTITVNANADQTLANIQTALLADANFAEFDFNVGVAGTFQSTTTADDQAAALLTGGTTEAAEASYANGVLTVTVDDSQDRTLNDIKASLDLAAAFADFDITINANGGNVFASTTTTDNVTSQALNGGSAGTDAILQDIITITTPQGAAFNGTITIDNSTDTAGAVTAAVDSDNNITITVDDNQNTTLADIITAIQNDLGGYTADLTTNNGDSTYTVSTDTFVTAAIADASSGGITRDVVFELGGEGGSEVFNISAGTTLDQLVSQINLVSEATGVSATSNGTTLELNSTGYGSKAVVDLRIIDEASDGTFTSAIGTGARSAGQDIVAKVNGVDASGDGNTLKINTGTLDMSISIEENFSGAVEFDITGGGALFQLGSQVVANQQARIGIGSVNTARLGGVNGNLFQLGEGGSAALATDPTTAQAIVDEAIDQVTSLRGRLGAFQRTTIESNLVSLNDSVANLQEAESSIRDADFAAESARLTRAQILVQSGTSVLALANQNPQNVLSLLG